MTDTLDVKSRIGQATERWPTVNPQELEQLARVIGKFPPEERLAPLLEVFVAPPAQAFLAQAYAGQLLMRFKPPCPHSIDATLRCVLPRWDLSVEQLPFYLREVFGFDEVIGSLDRLAKEGIEPRKLATVRYWLGARREPG